MFPSVSSFELIILVNLYLSSLAVHHYRDRSQGCIILSTNVTEVDKKLDDIPVEYPDVFPEDILEFPLEREIEFTIELVPGAGPISIAPY